MNSTKIPMFLTYLDENNCKSADSEYYKLALGITRTIPSAETLRQRRNPANSIKS